MKDFVEAKLRASVEFFAAHVTRVARGTMSGFHVLTNFACVSKTFIALLAFIRLFSSVDLDNIELQTFRKNPGQRL